MVDLSKIEAITWWQRPTPPTKVRRFLGLVRYYCRFMKFFSNIDMLMTKLTHKNIPLKWTDEC